MVQPATARAHNEKHTGTLKHKLIFITTTLPITKMTIFRKLIMALLLDYSALQTVTSPISLLHQPNYTTANCSQIVSPMAPPGEYKRKGRSLPFTKLLWVLVTNSKKCNSHREEEIEQAVSGCQHWPSAVQHQAGPKAEI